MAQKAPRMPKEELKEKLDDPQVEVIDVRQPKDKEQSDEKILGARLENPNEMDTWMRMRPEGKTYVLYCS